MIKCWTSTVVLLLAGCGLIAQSPVIGYTLSGGGAKGLAHIGVLQELEAIGLYPDCISGTSMGSIVGGLYAVGYSADELADFATELDWNAYFTDGVDRAFKPIAEIQRADRYQLTFPLVGGKLVLPKGLLRGRQIQTLLSLSTIDAHGISDLDSLRYPYRAIATDLEDGSAYVYDYGPLHHAMRASMAIPSVFAPVESADGRLLVDGLVVRNLPVSDAFDMGADYVLAVDVGAALLTREELEEGSLISIVNQTSSFVGAESIFQERKLADMLIDPALKPYSSLSYDAADSLIERGRQAAQQDMPRLLEQLDSLGVELPMEPPPFPRTHADSFFLTDIELRADREYATVTLERLLNLRAPGLLTRDELVRQINLLYGSGYFDLIDFQLLPTTNGRKLVIDATSRPPWRARFSLNFDSDFDAAFLANLTGRNVGLGGSLLAIDLKISKNPALWLEYLVYTRSRPNLGVRLQLQANFYPGKAFADRELVNEFNLNDYSLQFTGLLSLSNNKSLEAGLRLQRISQNPRFFSGGEQENIKWEPALGARLTRDTYDRTFYPREGSLLVLDAQRAIGGYIDRVDMDRRNRSLLADNLRLIGRFDAVFPMSKNWAILGRLRAGLLNGPRFNRLNELYIGREPVNDLRFTDFYGYRYMELAVDAYAQAGLDLRYQLGSDVFLSLGYQLGRITSNESGTILDRGSFMQLSEDRTAETIQGFALELGTITVVGPVLFGAQYQPDTGNLNYQLHAGYLF